MPRKSTLEELQSEEPAAGSPVRRSSRLVPGNGTPGTQRPAQTTESSTPARATRGRRASAQETEEENVESKPAPRTRRASILAEEEPTKEISTPAKRGRKPSVTQEDPEETVKPKPVRTRRASNISVEDPEEKPQKTAAVRTRRGSATVEPEPAAKTPAKATARRKTSTSDIAASEEAPASAKRVTRGRKNSDAEIIEDTKLATRGRKKSITLEEEVKVEEVKPVARRSRRASTDSLATDVGTPSRRTSRQSSEDVNSEISPVTKEILIKITPLKKRGIIEQVEAELDLSIINESVDDDENTSNSKSEKNELEISPSSRKRSSPFAESAAPLRKSPRLSEKSSPNTKNLDSPKGTPQRVCSPSNASLINQETLNITPKPISSPSNSSQNLINQNTQNINLDSPKGTPQKVSSPSSLIDQEPQVSTTTNDSFTQTIEEKLNASTESVGSNKENITVNEILEKSAIARRVSNVFKPNQREYSFMEPMEVDQTINQSLMEKSVSSPLAKEKIVADQQKKNDILPIFTNLLDVICDDEDKSSIKPRPDLPLWDVEELKPSMEDKTVSRKFSKLEDEKSVMAKPNLDVTKQDANENELKSLKAADAIKNQKRDDIMMARLEDIFKEDKIENQDETRHTVKSVTKSQSSDLMSFAEDEECVVTKSRIIDSSFDEDEVFDLETKADSAAGENLLEGDEKPITLDASALKLDVEDFVVVSDSSFVEETVDASKATKGSEILMSEVAKSDRSMVINETMENVGHSSSPLPSPRKSLRKSKSPYARKSLQNKDEEVEQFCVQIKQKTPQKKEELVDSRDAGEYIEADIEDKDDTVEKSENQLILIEDSDDEGEAGEIEKPNECVEQASKNKIEVDEVEEQASESEIEIAEDVEDNVEEAIEEDSEEEIEVAVEDNNEEVEEGQASENEIDIETVEDNDEQILTDEVSAKQVVKGGPKSKKWHLDEFASAKLTKYLESKSEYVENSTDEESKGNEDQENDEEESEVEYNSFIDGMAEEGEEDTPSEDSNQIVDHGESIGSSDSLDERSNEDYELDSFICDEEHAELLSGEEYDLEKDKKPKKRSRIMNNDQFGEEAIIKKPQKKKEEPKKKSSRIIPASPSSSEESLHVDKENVHKTENEVQQKESSVSPIPDKVSIDEAVAGNMPSLELVECEVQEPTIASKIADKESDDTKHEISFNAAESRASLSLLNQSRHRKSSLTIQENIFVDGVKDPRLSQRINSLLESFCSNVQKGEVSLNLSLEFADTAEGEDSPCTIQKGTDAEIIDNKQVDISVAGPSDDNQTNNGAEQVHQNEISPVQLETTGEDIFANIEDIIPPDDSQSEELNKSAGQFDLRDVINKKLKRRLSKSLSEVYEETKKVKKRKKNNGKPKPSPDLTGYLGANSFGLVNQLVSDVKNRPRRKIKPSSSAVVDDSWTSTVVSNLKPSTSVLKEEKKPVAPKLHPKDFKNQMLTDPSRVRRVETKTLLRKKGAFF